MRKIRFASIYLFTLTIVFFILGAYTEWLTFHHNVLVERINDEPLGYREFLHLIFFFFGFLALSSIYFAEKRETKALSVANMLLQKEIVEHKHAEEEREKLIKELQNALTKIKTLSSMLPICASCKKIRDDKNIISLKKILFNIIILI